MTGPGKYDDLCTEVRTKANADGAIVIVLNGDKGSGFSAQLPSEGFGALPQVIRALSLVIDQMKEDLAAATPNEPPAPPLS